MGLSAEHHVARRPIAGLPQAEDVFVSWLLAQPEGSDLAAAADIDIRRLDRYEGRHPGPQKLAELFREFQRCLSADPVAEETQ
ncbi:hypothetical protein NKJ26_30325 [Mesorhizobium sp. M0152]|uniref:hypothetical protein n=1 Tax=Mesorhizobium sp. M0152 TaxID=2956898 RepID=UPI0033388EDD